MRGRYLLAFLLTVTSLPLIAQVTYKTTFYNDGGRNVVSADFNRDGRPDLAFPNDGFGVRLSTGGGNFGDTINTPTQDFNDGAFLLAIDVNGDKYPDLLRLSQTADIFLSNHDGTFTLGKSLDFPQYASSAGAGDLNGDGKVDVVLFNKTRLQVFLGDGAGGFVPGQVLTFAQTPASSYARPFELVDVNGDGKLDLVFLEPSKLVIWPGNGSGSFGQPSFVSNPTGDPANHALVQVVVSDFNNDGSPDLELSAANFVSCNDGHNCGVGDRFIYRNDGRGNFTRINSFQAGPDAATVTAGDLNGDGNVDLLFSADNPDSPQNYYVFGNGNGTFGAEIRVQSATQVVLRDLNLDGRNDLVLSDSWGGGMQVLIAESGYVNCPPPGSATLAAKMCVPNTASAASPLLVRASGNSPLGVRRIEVWIDGKKAAQKLGSQFVKRFTLSVGTHRIAVVAVDKYLGTATTVRNVTIE
jgi:hypothetical protein